jgi:hypothetical protein
MLRGCKDFWQGVTCTYTTSASRRRAIRPTGRPNILVVF